MLTKQDLESIAELIDSKLEKRFKPIEADISAVQARLASIESSSDPFWRIHMMKLLTTMEKRIASIEGRFIKLETNMGRLERRIDRVETGMDKGFRSINKKLDLTSKFLDRDITGLFKRVDNIETRLQVVA